MTDEKETKPKKVITPEEKRANFVKLAQGRTQLALDAIHKIGNLSNGRAYEWTDADIAKISKALKDAMSAMERKFNPTAEKKDTFKL